MAKGNILRRIVKLANYKKGYPDSGDQKQKGETMFTAKSILSTLLISVILANPAFAANSTNTYHSGLFVLSFVGFCTLVVIAQLIPAVLMLFGMTKDVPEGLARKKV